MRKLLLIALLLPSLFLKSAAAEIIPRRTLLVDPDHTSIQLSPDGTRVGWLLIDSNGRHLFTRVVGGSSPDKEIAAGSTIVAWQWSSASDRVLLVTRGADGEELSLVSTEDNTGPVALASGSRVRPIGVRKTNIVVSVINNSPDDSGIFRIRLDGSSREKLADIGDADTWWVDANQRLVAARIQNETGFTLARLAADGTWTTIAEAGPLDGLPVGVVSVGTDGSHMYFTSRDGDDTTGLFELDVASNTKRLLFRDPDVDVLSIGGTMDPKTGRPTSVVSYKVRLQRHFLDETPRADVDALAKLRAGDVSIVGQSADDSRWLVRWLNGGPAHYAVWDRKAKRATDLFDEAPGLDKLTLASRRPLTVRSRDGLALRCDVYLPPNSDKNGDGIPDQPLPTVLYVHGGPWTGFEWNLWLVNRNFQLLANRGYAVIRAGFRSELGYGTKYMDAGDRAWGSAMHTDLVDIVEQATKLGIAKRGKIAIWGWSYGGYAVAAALTQAPQTFNCGLAMYGVYDLEALLRSPLADNWLWRLHGGDVRSPDDLKRIREQSPINHIDVLKNPILVTHGTRDERVPIAQSDTLVAALAKTGRDVPYLVFPEEGHDYAQTGSWEMFWAVGEAFLHEQLGGAAEPMSDEESRARVEVRSGAARIAAWRQSGKARG